jgi:hypothetical protein
MPVTTYLEPTPVLLGGEIECNSASTMVTSIFFHYPQPSTLTLAPVSVDRGPRANHR